jgi:hypothetical protein
MSPVNVTHVSCKVGPTWEWLLDHPRLLEAIKDLEGERLDRRGVTSNHLQAILRDMDRQDDQS